jgi:hypothetical protein
LLIYELSQETGAMLLEGVRSGRGMEIGSKEWKKFWEDYMSYIPLFLKVISQ